MYKQREAKGNIVIKLWSRWERGNYNFMYDYVTTESGEKTANKTFSCRGGDETRI